jgi:hypothetical protein
MPEKSPMFSDPLDRAVIAGIGAKIAFLDAVIWVVFGLESIVNPAQNNTRDAVWLLPGGLMLVVFWLVHLAQRSPQARFERIAYWILMAASTLVITVVLGLVSNTPELVGFTAVVGIMAWIVGLLVYGIATWKTGVLPWWSAVAIILFEPGSVAFGLALSPIAPIHDRGAYSAGIEKGIALAVVGLGLLAVRNRIRRQTGEPHSHSIVAGGLFVRS